MKTKFAGACIVIITFWVVWTALQLPPAGTYRLDTGKSEVYWKCDKHNGILPFKKGFLHIRKNGDITGKFDFDLSLFEVKDLDSAKYGTAKMILENTLKNEFFEIEKYPQAVFWLYDARPINDSIFRITGDLFFHGITNCVEFDGKLDYRQGVLHLKSKPFYIDRTDWGVYRLSPSLPVADDENGWTVTDSVRIRVDLVLERE